MLFEEDGILTSAPQDGPSNLLKHWKVRLLFETFSFEVQVSNEVTFSDCNFFRWQFLVVFNLAHHCLLLGCPEQNILDLFARLVDITCESA